jgi:hypothetical protein
MESVTDDPVDDLARARAEIEALRADNERLRTVLGLDDRRADGHTTAWRSTLFAEAASASANPVDGSSSLEERLALFRSLFGARSDAYAHRWENTSSGKSGWSPATRGSWSKKAASRDWLPLTDEVLAAHLRGERTIGIYPLMAGDACALLACDFDGGTWALDALAYLDACHAAGVPAALERSRSGNGAHVWVFFDGPVPASVARSLGAVLLREAMTARVEIDLASYDRLFPSQDYMPKGSLGNLIALPLQGERAAAGATVFLDPTTMAPWPDQWALLSSIARLPADAATELAKAAKPVDAGPGLSLADLAKAPGSPPPPVVRARFAGMLSIERGGLPPAIVAGLKHLASLHNPVFYEKQRMRFSTWDTPRFIRCYEEDLSSLHLPRGLAGQVATLLHQAGSRLEIDEAFPSHAPVGMSFTGTLRSGQRTAVEALAEHDHGVLVAPPGAGKTVMACALIARHDVPTLVLVDRKPLVEQWRERLAEHLDLDPGDIGVIGGGRSQPTGIVDVAMIQSVARRDDRKDLFARYGLVVADECHHLPAVSFETSVRHAPVRRWLGLTATPYRRDGLEGIITLQCGPVRHEIRLDADPQTALLRRDLVVHETTTDPPPDDGESIQDTFRRLVEDEARTTQICADVHQAVEDGRACLVLTQRTDHIDAIVARLVDLGGQPLVLRGGLGSKARSAVSDALEAYDNAERGEGSGNGIVLVATGSYLGEGFDWPALETLFLAFPLAFKGRVVQYVGRLLRQRDGKHHVELHDYVDVQIPVLDRMHTKRLAAYKTLGFDIPNRRQQRRGNGQQPF